uniref:(California timema) hypothetical protein n=1 Tax=Timema californicum TaxID=61474 RepID=A0A7R9J021_TIMCA|nr:unnamed protein product [Timema californicum]
MYGALRLQCPRPGPTSGTAMIYLSHFVLNRLPQRVGEAGNCPERRFRRGAIPPILHRRRESGTFSVTANQPGRQAARQPARADRGRAVTVREYACAGAWQPPASQACHRHAGRVPVSWFVSTSSSSDLRTMTSRDPVRRLQS